MCKHILEGLVTRNAMLRSVGAPFVTGINNRNKIDMTQRADRVCVAASNKANADNGNAKVH
jgi:hypothetical protein